MDVRDRIFNEKVESHAEKILTNNLKKLLDSFESKIFISLKRKNFTEAEEHLSQLCYEILDMEEEDQTFLLRIYFTSIITEIIRNLSRKSRSHPRVLAYAYAMISTIDSWKNVTEYFLGISWYIDCLATKLSADIVLFEGNAFITKALQLIDKNLEGDYLTVGWLAKELEISTTHLSNMFKLQVGETTAKYITNRKIEEITFEMTYTSKSLKDIREKYGFTNHSYFIQYFKKVNGKTPLKYKRSLLN